MPAEVATRRATARPATRGGVVFCGISPPSSARSPESRVSRIVGTSPSNSPTRVQSCLIWRGGTGHPDRVKQAVFLGLELGDLAADRVVGEELVLVGGLTAGDRLGDLVGQRQLAAEADAERVGDLVDRQAPKRGDHESLSLFLAAGEDDFLGLDRVGFGVCVGKAERGRRLGVRLARDAVEEGRLFELGDLGGDGLGSPLQQHEDRADERPEVDMPAAVLVGFDRRLAPTIV